MSEREEEEICAASIGELLGAIGAAPAPAALLADAAFDASIEANTAAARLGDDERRLKEGILEQLRSIVLRTLSRGAADAPRVRVFGSSGNGFGSPGADIDVSIEMSASLAAALDADRELHMPPGSVKPLLLLIRELQACGMHVEAVLHARVPILKLTVGGGEGSRIKLDLSVNNGLGVRNTQLLRAYAALDDRVRVLVLAVKRWAKSWRIADASAGFFSSYSWSLLAIFYLQRGAGIIPSLQDLDLLAAYGGERAAAIAGAFVDDALFVREWWRQKKNVRNARTGAGFAILGGSEAERGGSPLRPDLASAPASALLHGFFLFYARGGFDLLGAVASPRIGAPLPRSCWGGAARSAARFGRLAQVAAPAPPLWRWSLEDPLETARDLGSVLRFEGQRDTLRALAAAADLLSAAAAATAVAPGGAAGGEGPAQPPLFDRLCARGAGVLDDAEAALLRTRRRWHGFGPLAPSPLRSREVQRAVFGAEPSTPRPAFAWIEPRDPSLSALRDPSGMSAPLAGGGQSEGGSPAPHAVDGTPAPAAAAPAAALSARGEAATAAAPTSSAGGGGATSLPGPLLSSTPLVSSVAAPLLPPSFSAAEADARAPSSAAETAPPPPLCPPSSVHAPSRAPSAVAALGAEPEATPAAVAAALPSRAWTGEAPPPSSARGGEGFVVATYNILAPSYATSGFEYCPAAALAWPARARLLASECLALDADILALQEAEAPQLEALAAPLRAAGYAQHFTSNTKADVQVGVALFFRSERFELLGARPLHLYDLSRDAELLRAVCGTPRASGGGAAEGGWSSPASSPRRGGRGGSRAAAAAAASASARPWSLMQHNCHRRFWAGSLQSTHNSGSALVLRDRATARIIIAASFHAYWAPAFPDIKAMQLALVSLALDRLRRALDAEAAAAGRADTAQVLLLGDFNAPPRILRDERFEDVALLDRLEAAAAYPPATAAGSSDGGLGATPADTAAHPAAVAATEAAATAGSCVALARAGVHLTTTSHREGLSRLGSGTISALKSGELEQAHPHHPFTRRSARAPASAASAAAAVTSPPNTPQLRPLRVAEPENLHPESVPPLRLPLRFTSAYEVVNGAEPLWTNWHWHSFRETLDYIMLASHSRPCALVLAAAGGGGAGGVGGAAGGAADGASGASIDAAAAATGATPPRALAAAAGDDSESARFNVLAPVSPPPSPASSSPPLKVVVGMPPGARIECGPWQALACAAQPAAAARGDGAARALPAQVALRAVGVLAIPADAEVLRFAGAADGGCPNAGCGSDHIPLAAYLRWL